MTDAIRIAPDGRIAQRARVSGRYGTDLQIWVGIDWPDGLLTVHRYTDNEVSDWRELDLTPPTD